MPRLSDRTTFFAFIFSLLCAFSVTPHVSAQEHDEHAASRLFELGMAAFRAEDFAAAYERFRAAYELYPSADMLFNMGVSAERIERFDDAVEHFRRYIELVPNGRDRADAERRLLVVRARRQAATTRESETSPITAERAAASASTERAEEVSSPFNEPPNEQREATDGSVFGKWWFWTIVGVVVAGGVTAAVIAAQPGSDPPVYAPSDIGTVVFALEPPR